MKTQLGTLRVGRYVVVDTTLTRRTSQRATPEVAKIIKMTDGDKIEVVFLRQSAPNSPYYHFANFSIVEHIHKDEIKKVLKRITVKDNLFCFNDLYDVQTQKPEVT